MFVTAPERFRTPISDVSNAISEVISELKSVRMPSEHISGGPYFLFFFTLLKQFFGNRDECTAQKIPHGSNAQDFPHIYTSNGIPHKNLSHKDLFQLNKPKKVAKILYERVEMAKKLRKS